MFTATAALADAEVHVGMNVLEDLCRHAESTFPHECCGVVKGRMVRDRMVFFELLPAGNIAPAQQRDRFHVDWSTLLDGLHHVNAGSAQCMAFYHSHTNGCVRPSDLDLQSSWPGVPVFIVPVISGKARRPTLWMPPGAETKDD